MLRIEVHGVICAPRRSGKAVAQHRRTKIAADSAQTLRQVNERLRRGRVPK